MSLGGLLAFALFGGGLLGRCFAPVGFTHGLGFLLGGVHAASVSMPGVGLEPTRLAAASFKVAASTCSAIPALPCTLLTFDCTITLETRTRSCRPSLRSRPVAELSFRVTTSVVRTLRVYDFCTSIVEPTVSSSTSRMILSPGESGSPFLGLPTTFSTLDLTSEITS